MSKVLVACEKTQAVTIKLREMGIEAYSCDTEYCSGGHPEWHLHQDVVPLLNQRWAMVIAFPPCTHLASSGAKHFAQKRESGVQQKAIEFFMKMAYANSSRVAIENPVGIMSRQWRKPDQIINPYQFGDPVAKRTCLWLRGLPKLVPTRVVSTDDAIEYDSGKKMSTWYDNTFFLPKSVRGEVRSETFPGIAEAMAKQWGALV